MSSRARAASRYAGRGLRRRLGTPIRAACGMLSKGHAARTVRLINLYATPELLILIADELDEFSIRHDLLINPHGERLDVRLRILDRDVKRKTAERGACKSLCKFCLTAVRT